MWSFSWNGPLDLTNKNRERRVFICNSSRSADCQSTKSWVEHYEIFEVQTGRCVYKLETYCCRRIFLKDRNCIQVQEKGT